MFHVEQDEERLREFFLASARQLHIDLSEATLGKFLIYLRELIKWNEKINLTSVTDKKTIIAKHFLDSLMGIRALDSVRGPMLIDIGSGAGFPGIPLKIMRESAPLHLIEPNKKKASFLTHLIGCLKLSNCSIFSAPFENFTQNNNDELSKLFLVRALKIDEMIGPLCANLGTQGRLILYRSIPFEKNPWPDMLRIEQEFSYELPHDMGNRTISVCKSLKK